MCSTCMCSLYVRWYLTLICPVMWNTSECHKVTLSLLPSPVLEAKTNCSRADTEPMRETIIKESDRATPKAIGWLRGWGKFLWGHCRACCDYPSVSSGLLLEKKKTIPVRLYFPEYVVYSEVEGGCHLFEADGWEESTSLSLSGGFRVRSDHTSLFLFPSRCEWRDTVSIKPAVVPVLFLFFLGYIFESFSVLFLVWLSQNLFWGGLSVRLVFTSGQD